jgi:hypothetical protein
MVTATIHARVAIATGGEHNERRKRRRRAIGNRNNKQRVTLDLMSWIIECSTAFHKRTTRFKTTTCPIMNLALHSLNCVGSVAMILIRLSVQVSKGSPLGSDSVWPVQLHHQDLVPLLRRRDDGEVDMVVLAEF